MILPENPPRLMSPSNQMIAYGIGIATLLLALHCFLRPRQEYGRFGLPLENAQTNAKAQSHSPFIFIKGSRELICGLTLIVLQYQGNVNAITTFVAILSTAGLIDGLVVWFNGGQEYKHKAFGHWFAFVFAGSWAAWRARQAWQDSQEGKWPEGHFHIWSS
ncbi:hypothetical protein LA080_002074 [Diaporthe eres]|uniref:Integral membrane protein n=1 Tax=Diaporthe vaccinii TaxID=105482 RepID=A0ABR4DYF9_9PEZI|nr:hypothetical protein LA080_002074 [Diaporthe eres]